jgi:cell division protein FtsL
MVVVCVVCCAFNATFHHHHERKRMDEKNEDVWAHRSYLSGIIMRNPVFS